MDVSVCQDCAARLTDENWTPSHQKYGRYVCAPCWSKRQRGYARVANERDPEHAAQKRAKARKRQALWSTERKLIEREKKYGRWIKRKYGITLTEYRDLARKQGDVCAICQRPRVNGKHQGKGSLHVDHDHATGNVRGLLCGNCNFIIGLSDESPTVLHRAVSYLKYHQEHDARAEKHGKAF